MTIMEWFKVNGYNYMYGSLRIDTPIQRLVFVELLALASISRVRRTVCLSEGVPYPRAALAGIIGISESELNSAIEHHLKPEQNRLLINKWGGIEVVKWDYYQSKSYDRVRKFRDKKNKCNTNVTQESVSCNGREENRIEENRIEENIILSEKFNEFRKLYPGTKLGNDTEYKNFAKKHKDYLIVLPELKNIIKKQIAYKEKLKAANKFCPEWKNLQTWINQRCWEEVMPEIVKAKTPEEELGERLKRLRNEK